MGGEERGRDGREEEGKRRGRESDPTNILDRLTPMTMHILQHTFSE